MFNVTEPENVKLGVTEFINGKKIKVIVKSDII